MELAKLRAEWFEVAGMVYAGKAMEMPIDQLRQVVRIFAMGWLAAMKTHKVPRVHARFVVQSFLMNDWFPDESWRQW